MMGGNPRDLARQMQQMQTRLAKIQEELGSETVEASVGGGMVTITMTGHQQVESVTIDPDAVDMTRAVDERGYPATEHASMDWSDGPLKLMPWWSSFTESGVQGDATKATPEKGRVLFAAAVDELSGYVDELRSLEIPQRKDHH